MGELQFEEHVGSRLKKGGIYEFLQSDHALFGFLTSDFSTRGVSYSTIRIVSSLCNRFYNFFQPLVAEKGTLPTDLLVVENATVLMNRMREYGEYDGPQKKYERVKVLIYIN